MVHVHAVPVFSDNYLWMITGDDGRAAAVVDPGAAAPVVEALGRHGRELVGVLVTHHHRDHAGGVGDLVERHPAPVFGPASEAIAGVDNPVRGGQVVVLAELGLYLRVENVPGHTAGHVAYVGPEFAFVGDCLFGGGCGRVFEGSMEQMHESLRRLAALPPETLLYCGHEYTVANLRFARRVEPGNAALERRLAEAVEARSDGRPTVPSTVADELATNPFMRCHVPEVARAAETKAGRSLATADEVFGVLRSWKDGWSG